MKHEVIINEKKQIRIEDLKNPSIIGKSYLLQDNSYNKNISHFVQGKAPEITCACPASNEVADLVTIITEPFKMKPIWILDTKEMYFVIVEKDGHLYSTIYYERGLLKD